MAGPSGDEESLAEIASEATEDGTSAISAATTVCTAYTPKKEDVKTTASTPDKKDSGVDSVEAAPAIETDALGDAGQETAAVDVKDKVVEKAEAEKLDVKMEDVDEVLKELMLYADMSSRDCQPFLTRHAYVHRCADSFRASFAMLPSFASVVRAYYYSLLYFNQSFHRLSFHLVSSPLRSFHFLSPHLSYHLISSHLISCPLLFRCVRISIRGLVRRSVRWSVRR